jgi:hypothetical protein
MARDSHVARVLSEPFFKLHKKRQCSILNHLQAFSFWRRKIVASVNLGKPFRPFHGNLALALALKQTVATFNKPVIRENWNWRMRFKNDFKSSPSSFKVRGKSIVNLVSPELLRNLPCLQKPFRGEFWVAPTREYSTAVISRLSMPENKQPAIHSNSSVGANAIF